MFTLTYLALFTPGWSFEWIMYKIDFSSSSVLFYKFIYRRCRFGHTIVDASLQNWWVCFSMPFEISCKRCLLLTVFILMTAINIFSTHSFSPFVSWCFLGHLDSLHDQRNWCQHTGSENISTNILWITLTTTITIWRTKFYIQVIIPR